MNDIEIIRNICLITSTRAASLIAASTVALLSAVDNLPLYGDVVVGYAGSVIHSFPRFKERVERVITELCERELERSDGEGSRSGLGSGSMSKSKSERRVIMEYISESGLIGAAVLAAVVQSINDQTK